MLSFHLYGPQNFFTACQLKSKLSSTSAKLLSFIFFAFADLAITSRIMFCSVILYLIHSSDIINGLNFNRNPLKLHSL